MTTAYYLQTDEIRIKLDIILSNYLLNSYFQDDQLENLIFMCTKTTD